MGNCKLLVHIITFALCIQYSSAQQVYQSSHYGRPGDLYLYNRLSAGFNNDQIILDGENVTWDLSTNLQLNTHINELVETNEAFDPFAFLAICPLSGLSSGECFTIWNNTQQALLLKDTLSLLQFTLTDLQRYQRKTADRLYENFIGFTVEVQGTPTSAVIVYQNPDTIIHFPAIYGNEWTSYASFNLDLEPAGQNLIYASDQSRTTSIDSWGTLMTPYDTFENIVRLRSDILRHDTITMDSSTFNFTYSQVEYMWLDTNYSLPVMTAHGDILPGDSIVINVIEYIYESTCPAPTWSVDIGSDVFYIDDTGAATVQFNIIQSNANEYTWDFGDGTFAVTDGGISHDYFEPGEYTIAVNGCMTNCLPLNSCSFQIIDFVVIDTLTSISTIPGADLGIKLYPSPANDFITVFMPVELSYSYYQVIDLTGRPVASGQLVSGQSTLNIRELQEGMYVLQFVSPKEKTSQSVFMRFNVMRQ